MATGLPAFLAAFFFPFGLLAMSKTKTSDLRDMSLAKLIQQFADEQKCYDTLIALRWPAGVACPRCGDTSVSTISTRYQWDCNSCRYRFSVTAGTIFDNTKLPLWKWFVAVYLMVESKKGISAAQIARTLEVSYPTAWHLCHRIREAMDDDSDTGRPMLAGIVEVDETWIGGKNIGAGKENRLANKVTVAGALERGGNIRLAVVKDRSKTSLHGFIRNRVSDDAEAIYTDEWVGYWGIGDKNTEHYSVNHRAKEWVVGDVHTNGIESVWSLLKRSIVGSFHKISVKHLDRYLDELEWRFNNRDNPFIFKDTMTRLAHGNPLRYYVLTA
jgi:transposase-like protein